ncbi:MAG: glycerol-3-phosphate acyltransferase [Clostridiales bacterium]|nr:glycerol-3-phosphate acyltransferase [Clostridiales bacterium]
MTISVPMQILAGALVAVGSYFVGNINNAILISRLKGNDIRQCGSGNPGTMNMLRTYGKALGVLTLILDVLKGVVPCLLGWLFMGNGQFLRLGSDRIGMYVAGIFAVLGHIYPVTMKFHGGKGAATIIGVCLTLQPLYTLVTFVFGVVFLIVTKVGSLTSFIIISAPLALEGLRAAQNPIGVYASIILFAMYLLSLFAHHKNVSKSFYGNEGRVVLFKPKKAKPQPDRSFVYEDYVIAE